MTSASATPVTRTLRPLWAVVGALAVTLGCGGGSSATKPTSQDAGPATAPIVVEENENHVDEPLTDATSPCPAGSPHCGDTAELPTTSTAPAAAEIPATPGTTTTPTAPGTTAAAPPARGGKKPVATAPAATAPTPAQVAHGAQIFNKYCDTCHPGGNAEPDYGPKIRDLNWSVPRVTAQIRNGKGKMKPIPPKKISDTDLPDLLAYLVTLRAVTGVPR